MERSNPSPRTSRASAVQPRGQPSERQCGVECPLGNPTPCRKPATLQRSTGQSTEPPPGRSVCPTSCPRWRRISKSPSGSTCVPFVGGSLILPETTPRRIRANGVPRVAGAGEDPARQHSSRLPIRRAASAERCSKGTVRRAPEQGLLFSGRAPPCRRTIEPGMDRPSRRDDFEEERVSSEYLSPRIGGAIDPAIL